MTTTSTPIQQPPAYTSGDNNFPNLSGGQLHSKPVKDISAQIKNLSDKLEELDAYERKKFLMINGIFGVIAVGTIACFIAMLALMTSSAGTVLIGIVCSSLLLTPCSYAASRAIFLSDINYKLDRATINTPEFKNFVIAKNVNINLGPFDIKKLHRIVLAYCNYSLAQKIRENTEKRAMEAEEKAKADLKEAEEHAATIKQKVQADEFKKAETIEGECDLLLSDNYEKVMLHLDEYTICKMERKSQKLNNPDK